MFERYTDRARHAVVKAQDEARLDRRHLLGTAHLLLGLPHDKDSVAGRILIGSHGASVEQVRPLAAKALGYERAEADPPANIPFSPDAKRACELALRESITLGRDYIGTEHLLLALARNADPHPPTDAQKVLGHMGLNCQQLRDEVLEVLGGYQDAAASRARGAKLAEGRGQPQEFPAVFSVREQLAALFGRLDAVESQLILSRLTTLEMRMDRLEAALAELKGNPGVTG